MPTILEILKEWDISETDRILEHVNAVREKKNEEERKLRQAETKR